MARQVPADGMLLPDEEEFLRGANGQAKALGPFWKVWFGFFRASSLSRIRCH